MITISYNLTLYAHKLFPMFEQNHRKPFAIRSENVITISLLAADYRLKTPRKHPEKPQNSRAVQRRVITMSRFCVDQAAFFRYTEHIERKKRNQNRKDDFLWQN